MFRSAAWLGSSDFFSTRAHRRRCVTRPLGTLDNWRETVDFPSWGWAFNRKLGSPGKVRGKSPHVFLLKPSDHTRSRKWLWRPCLLVGFEFYFDAGQNLNLNSEGTKAPLETWNSGLTQNKRKLFLTGRFQYEMVKGTVNKVGFIAMVERVHAGCWVSGGPFDQ